MMKYFYTLIIILAVSIPSLAQQKVISIWPLKAPGSESVDNREKIVNGRAYNVYQPRMAVFMPVKRNSAKPAVLIFPGGGYDHVTFVKEGYNVASWLNSIGVAAFVLTYRLNRNYALDDAERALRLIRSKSEDYGINPDNIGVMGFSAGGHLALNLAVHSGNPEKLIEDKIDNTSCKADFLVLAYPQADSLASIKFLSKEITPTFIVQAADDKTVPIETSVKLFEVLHSLSVPVELHIFEKGGHGFGMGKEGMPDTVWPDLCRNWMTERRILVR